MWMGWVFGKSVVAFITGAGFKTAEYVQDHLKPALEVDANFESFENAYAALQPAGVAI